MKKFIVHIQKFVSTKGLRGRFVTKRLEIMAENMTEASKEAIQLNPNFEISMIWPEWRN